MKSVFKGLYLFMALMVVLVVYDYSKNDTVNWFNNISSSILFVFFFMLFQLFFNIFKKKAQA